MRKTIGYKWPKVNPLYRKKETVNVTSQDDKEQNELLTTTESSNKAVEQKPREFWIVNLARVYTSFGFMIDAHGLRNQPQDETRHHVIEYSAFTKLQQELTYSRVEHLKAANENIKLKKQLSDIGWELKPEVEEQ